MDINKEELKMVLAEWTDKDGYEHSGVYNSKDTVALRNQLRKWKKQKKIQKYTIVKVEGYGG